MRCRWEPRHTTTQPASRQGRHRLLCVLGRTVRDPRRVLRVRVGGSFLVCQPAPCCVVLRPDCCAERPFGPSPGGAERVRRDAVCCAARYGVDVRTHGAVFTYSASTAATYDESITTAASFDSGSIVLHGNILYAGGKFKTHHEWGVPFTVAVAETAAGTVFNSAPDAAGFPSPALHGLRLAAPPLLSECCACGHRAWWLLVRVPGRTLGVIGFDVSRGHEQVFKFDSPVCRSSGCGTQNHSGRMTAPALLNGAQMFFFARFCSLLPLFEHSSADGCCRHFLLLFRNASMGGVGGCPTPCRGGWWQTHWASFAHSFLLGPSRAKRLRRYTLHICGANRERGHLPVRQRPSTSPAWRR